MLNVIHKMFKKAYSNVKAVGRRSKNKLSDKTGQVGVVIILITAMALIFYAATLNFGKVSNSKVQVTMASNAGAAVLGSQIASYAQSLYKESLGGEREQCGWTGILKIIIIIVLIIIVIIACIFQQYWVAAALAGVGAALAAAALIIQMVAVQPGLTNMWEKISRAAMSTVNQMNETGIQTALNIAVSDQVQVADLTDIDADAKFGLGALGEPLDTTSRFGAYYNERMKSIKLADTDSIRIFLDSLRKFIYGNAESTNTWALHDPVPDCTSSTSHQCCYQPAVNNFVPQKCNVCCQPEAIYNESIDDLQRVRPECCDEPAVDASGEPNLSKCGDPNQCKSEMLYGLDYYNLYDPYMEDYYNNGLAWPEGVVSFRERLGTDDENDKYSNLIRPFFPHSFNAVLDPQEPWTLNPFMSSPSFVASDSSGYFHTDNFYTEDADSRPGIFSFFYKIADWGLDLRTIADNVGNAQRAEHCYWFDFKDYSLDPALYPDFILPANPARGGCAPDLSAINFIEPSDQAWLLAWELGSKLLPIYISQRLDLPIEPAFLLYNTNYFVDSVEESAAVPGGPIPLAPDAITDNGTIVSPDNFCAQYIYLDSGPIIDLPDHVTAQIDDSNGFWKRGSDRYCTDGDAENPSEWPFHGDCPKRGGYGMTCPETIFAGTPQERDIPSYCDCGETGAMSPDNWPDDALDNIIYGIPNFIDVATQLFDTPLIDLAQNFPQWYSDIAEWIEPKVPPASKNNNPPNPICFDCENPSEGILHVWSRMFQEMIRRLNNFISEESHTGSCDEVYCVPSGACPNVYAAEAATYDVNSNGVRGDIEDVVACLSWAIGNVLNDDGTIDVNPASEVIYPDPLDVTYPITAPAIPYPFDDSTTPEYQYANEISPSTNIAQKFERCAEYCTDDTCDELPRSLVPGFDPSTDTWSEPAGFDPNCQYDIYNMIQCWESCSEDNCRALPFYEGEACGRVAAGCAPYFPAAPLVPAAPVPGAPSLPPIFDETIHCTSDIFPYFPVPPGPPAAFVGGSGSSLDTNPANWGACGAVQYFAFDPAIEFAPGNAHCPGGLWNPVDPLLAEIQIVRDWIAANEAAAGNLPSSNPDWGAINACALGLCAACDNMHQFSTDPDLSAWGPGNTWFDLINQAIITAASLNVDDQALHIAAFDLCLNNCSDANCQAMPEFYRDPDGPIGWVPGHPYRDWIENYSLPLAVATGDAPAIPQFNACLASCTNATCGTMPEYVGGVCAALGAPLFTDDPADFIGVGSKDADPVTGRGHECEEGDPSCSCEIDEFDNWRPKDPWFSEIMTALIRTPDGNPACDFHEPSDPNAVTSYLWKVRQSSLEAANQVEKFEHRRNYLKRRIGEAEDIVDILQDGVTEFDKFLSCDVCGPTDCGPCTPADDAAGICGFCSPVDQVLGRCVNDIKYPQCIDPLNPGGACLPNIKGPACQLIKDRIDHEKRDEGLPNQVIYGWQDPDVDGETGSWHVVKVETKIPQKCDGKCATDDADTWLNGPQEFPRVKTFTKSSGFKRCYALVGYPGLIKVRVTRFDEDSKTQSDVKLPGGLKLWNFKGTHPSRWFGASTAGLETDCKTSMITRYPDDSNFPPPPAIGHFSEDYYRAFILNEKLIDLPLDKPDSVDNQNCWNHANKLLTRGITAETCAKYYYHGGRKKGMSFKFVPCQEF